MGQDRQHPPGGQRVDHPLRAHGRRRVALVRMVLDLGVGQVGAHDVRHRTAVVVLKAPAVLRHDLLELLRHSAPASVDILPRLMPRDGAEVVDGKSSRAKLSCCLVKSTVRLHGKLAPSAREW